MRHSSPHGRLPRSPVPSHRRDHARRHRWRDDRPCRSGDRRYPRLHLRRQRHAHARPRAACGAAARGPHPGDWTRRACRTVGRRVPQCGRGTCHELDKGHRFARGHPGVHVVPAVLAWAGAHEVHGRDALLAVILGYEAAARLGSAMRMRAGGHPHGTWGTVGRRSPSGSSRATCRGSRVTPSILRRHSPSRPAPTPA